MDEKELIRKILGDIKVDALQEFDNNFRQQGFFGEAWERRTSPLGGDSILVGTGNLKRSIFGKSDESGITFHSDLPYAAIHNEGGKIRVTRKMKGFFWWKYRQACGGFSRRKDGSFSRSKRQVRLTSTAEFWKSMALKKEGSYIVIPKRRFIGNSPQLAKDIEAIIFDDLQKFFENNKTEFIKEK